MFGRSQHCCSLSTPIEFNTPTFCVGVYSGPEGGGFRMETELAPGEGSDSSSVPQNCGINSFATLDSCCDLGGKKFCIVSVVRGN